MIVRVILLLLGLASGVMLAAAAFYGVFGTSTPQQTVAAPPAPPPPPKTMLVVAARTVPTGTLMTFEDLRFAQVEPGQTTAADYLRQNEPAPKEQAVADRRVFAEIAGAVARARFTEGAPIQRDSIVKPGDSGFLAAVLRPGMRAITLAVNVITGDAGLLFPGDHVDIVLTQTFAGHEIDPGNRSVAETVASDLRVIAVDQRLQAGAAPQKEVHPAQTVTLEVNALQAEQITVGAKMGEMALAIRGVPGDGRDGEQVEVTPAPPAVWAHDVSPASAELLPPNARQMPPPPGKGPGGANMSDKPPLRVIHGDKVESVVLP